MHHSTSPLSASTTPHITTDKDIVLITLDTLRYDIAQQELEGCRLPVLSQYINTWEKRHAPGSFTYSAHHAIFAGFLPTPYNNPKAERLFALDFPGSETTSATTRVFDAPDIISGFKQAGYYTACIGGVGFFNKLTPLGSVFPNMFDKSYWDVTTGVTTRDSTEHQIKVAGDILRSMSNDKRVFLFINISAIHQPNHFYVADTQEDSLQTHAAALRYVDSQLTRLFNLFKQRHDTFYIMCSDHGTAYGEEGYQGHRLAHDTVWTVPYAHFTIPYEK